MVEAITIPITILRISSRFVSNKRLINFAVERVVIDNPRSNGRITCKLSAAIPLVIG